MHVMYCVRNVLRKQQGGDVEIDIVAESKRRLSTRAHRPAIESPMHTVFTKLVCQESISYSKVKFEF
jgi:hypothetical protein